MIKWDAMKSAAKSRAMKSFGQEFYPHESLRALRLAEKLKTSSRRELTLRLAQDLPHPSPATRKRLAAKFIQRYISATRSRIVPPSDQQAFLKLVSRLRHAPALIQLLFYELQKTDELVGVLARELFYPAFVENRAPDEYSTDEFAARNGSRLLGDEPLLTRNFILDHALEKWNFKDRASVDRALRVLIGAGLIARERMTDLRNHPVAFRRADHDLAPSAFAWAFYDEYLPRARNGDLLIAREEILKAKCARTFLIAPAQIEASLETARRHQLLAAQGLQVRLVFAGQSTLVDALLSKAM
jgi:hypothetical protein